MVMWWMRGHGWMGFEAAQFYAMLRAPAHAHMSKGSSVMMIAGELPSSEAAARQLGADVRPRREAECRWCS